MPLHERTDGPEPEGHDRFPLGEREGAAAEVVTYYENWEKALADFEEGQYEKALEQFKALAAQKEDDKVARYYIKITEDFFIKGKYPTEHDDVGVAFNPEDRVFKLMQK